jgi:hypothetical protein
MARRIHTLLAALLASFAFAGAAQAAGGNYLFDGGTPKQQAEVRKALNASAFPWSIVPATVTIHIAPGADSYATPGHLYLDADLLDSGRFAWATVQDEYAHQIDFFLLDPAKREQLNRALGGLDWCYGIAGLAHSAYGCERFASTLVWAYWPSSDNAYKPSSASDESAAMKPAKFRALLAQLIGAADTLGAKTASTKRPA